MNMAEDPMLRQLLRAAAEAIRPSNTVPWEPEPHQIPPPQPWFGWLLMGGRGSGKTAPCAKYFHDHMMGPPCLPHIPGGHWASIVGPTLGDAVTSCVTGPSGLIKWQPDLKVRQRIGGAEVIYPNGASAKLFGASTPDDVERFRAGGNRCLVWMEELAAWRYMEEAYQQIRYGLRVGPHPHWICSTTPKPRALLKKMLNDKRIVVTGATTADNPHLATDVKDALYEDYGNTRLGRQELAGQLLEDVPQAIWKLETIERFRVDSIVVPEYLDRIAISLDPAVMSDAVNNETGIIAGGSVNQWFGPDGEGKIYASGTSHAFVWDDQSMQGTPQEWAEMAVFLFNKYQANTIVAEINQGGEMVAHTLRTVKPGIPVKVVHATRGKAIRAEPVGALYEQGRVHHVGNLALLEDQMTLWNPEEPDPAWSPDRMDALVWLITYLLVGNSQVRRSRMIDKRLRGRR